MSARTSTNCVHTHTHIKIIVMGAQERRDKRPSRLVAADGYPHFKRIGATKQKRLPAARRLSNNCKERAGLSLSLEKHTWRKVTACSPPPSVHIHTHGGCLSPRLFLHSTHSTHSIIIDNLHALRVTPYILSLSLFSNGYIYKRVAQW